MKLNVTRTDAPVRIRVIRVARRLWRAVTTGRDRADSWDSCERSSAARSGLRTAFLTLLLAAGGAMLGGVGGCDREPGDGPPVVRFGQDVCAHCNMIVSDPKSVAASVVVRDWTKQVVVFDDLFDQVQYHAAHPTDTVVKRYVSDYATKAWIEASAAKYVRAEGVHTPMGSGLLAFATDEAADAAAKQHNGTRVAFESLSASTKGDRGAADSGGGGDGGGGGGGGGAGGATTCPSEKGVRGKAGGCCHKEEAK